MRRQTNTLQVPDARIKHCIRKMLWTFSEVFIARVLFLDSSIRANIMLHEFLSKWT